MKAFLRLLLRWWFGFEAHGVEALSAKGPVLLIPNHMSWLDWLFIGVCLDDDWRFVTSSTTAQTTWIHRKIMVNRRTFPVDTTSPYAARRMAGFLSGGGRLVLFAEGRISTTGALMKLFDGTGFLLQRTGARVVLCRLRGVERVRWVKHPGWRRLRTKVTAHFEGPLTPPVRTDLPRTIARPRLTTWLRDAMVKQQFDVEQAFGPDNVLDAVVETARCIPAKVVLEDYTFSQVDYRRLLVGVRLLATQWSRLWGAADERRRETVGVLLPNVNGAPATVLSLWAAGRTPALLNFSSGTATMVHCARMAGMSRIVTSRAFAERAKLDLSAFAGAGVRLVYLEDVRGGIGAVEKVLAALAARFRCGAGVDRRAMRGDETAVVLFTSGSEGRPKGVRLSHRGMLANIRQTLAVLDLEDSERVFNALPLFHSFGLGTCLLLPLVRGLYTFLYPSPLHYRVIPSAIYDRECTVVVGTNTFLNGYARKAHPYDFHTVKYLVAGAEKVQESTRTTYATRFGLRILEGYGATECSPVVAVNSRVDNQAGAAGRFLPGIEWRLEPVEGIEKGGRLWVRGPNLMEGYVDPADNAKFLAGNGWYDTGDLAHVDDDGFVHLLGRLKRFAKISGEMVSLGAVEDALAGAFPQYGGRCEVAVVARADHDKGEALVAVCSDARVKVEELRAAVLGHGLSALAVPREIVVLKEIPKLGTGKTDYRRLNELVAEARAANPA
jgi:acyl-[acyl-carrier-protein]-phospholipid O-acyltransferase / long-chain-fatty-acid--[acyl-carrier-protein] ligase